MTAVPDPLRPPPEVRRLLGEVKAVLPRALERYLDLHRHPELSGHEERTAARVGAALAGAGLDVTYAVGGHGLVGVIRNGVGPVVLLRAELDALPVREETGLPYASTATAAGPAGEPAPIMHACGHDLHLAALCATADVLARARDGWRGTVLAVGQPAEETLSGAAAMLADGLYTRWERPDAALAQHVSPMPAGFVGHSVGPPTAGSRTVRIRVPGRGGHAGYPGAALNPIPVAAAIVTRLGERFAHPGRDGVLLTIGALHAGTRENIVPDEAVLLLTLRGFGPAPLDRAVGLVRAEVTALCAAAGCPSPPDIAVTAACPPGRNDPSTAQRVRDGHRTALGGSRVLSIPPSPATDDFALLRTGPPAGPPVPTVYWATGSVSKAAWARAPGTGWAEKLAGLPVNHSPRFAPDPVRTLHTATVALLAGAWSVLAGSAEHDDETQPEGDQT